ncbi:MAG: hypothetical protein M3O02_05220 [Acidobacteriota bacterium]|nr:hypothetical protein [Acidobacteriota bacterium]
MRAANALSVALLALVLAPVEGQTRTGALSDREIDQVRESRLIPAESILLFVKFLDVRSDRISALYAKGRRPGREQDTHDLMEQFTTLVDELDDNLADYGPRHADLRRALPRLLQALDRWSTAIKTPPEDDVYAVSRKIALESIRDLRETATQMTTEQEAWFKAHPPAKQKDGQGTGDEITIRR